MAQQEDDFHFQMRESPYHSRDASFASNWQAHSRDVSGASGFRPVTEDSYRPYQAGDFADSTRHLVPHIIEPLDDASPTHSSFNLASPTQQSFLPKDVRHQYSPPESPGYHPGFPGPESPGSPNHHTWPLNGSPLAVPENVQQRPDSRQSFSRSVSKEYVQPPKLEAPPKPMGPPGGPPPDGGTTAWLQVLGGYFLFFNTWGLINAFGVFQT